MAELALYPALMHEIELHLRIRVPVGGEQPLREFLNDAIPFYEAPGGIHMRLVRDASDPLAFIEIVEYATREDYAADQHRVANDPEMAGYLERWRKLLDGPPGVEVWEQLEC